MKKQKTKKIFNKKFLALGVISLFALALVSSALVNYLSNTAESDVSVKSPLEIEIDGLLYEGNGNLSLEGGKVVGNVYGGESYTVQATLRNLANAEITGVRTELAISSDSGIESGEIISIVFSDNAWTGELINDYSCIVDGVLYAYIGSVDGFNVPIGYESSSETTITFTQNIAPETEYFGESKVVTLDAVKC